ncbi:MAG: hypothetical protein JWR35_205, partial [Marmoricola sp.]|nr:hypothetical protein [Marmoricola sp.]
RSMRDPFGRPETLTLTTHEARALHRIPNLWTTATGFGRLNFRSGGGGRVAGYSGTPLETKLGVRDGQTIFLDGAPTGFELDARTTSRLPKRIDLTLTFHTSAALLAKRLPELIARTEQAGMIWVCWPKKSALKATGMTTDLDDNVVRRTGLDAGLVDVKVAAIDEVWSGLKFVRRLADRL